MELFSTPPSDHPLWEKLKVAAPALLELPSLLWTAMRVCCAEVAAQAYKDFVASRQVAELSPEPSTPYSRRMMRFGETLRVGQDLLLIGTRVRR